MRVWFTWEKHMKIVELGELLGLESVNLVIKKGRLRWFWHVKHENVADCIVSYNETRQEKMTDKTWLDGIQDDMKSFGLSWEDTEVYNLGDRKLRDN